MRLNPLWLLALLFLLPGAGLLLAPVMLIMFACVAAAALTGLGGASALWLTRDPAQMWTLLTNARARANFSLANAVCRVISERYGTVFRASAGGSGFFLSGVGDETAVYEAAVTALARLKNGETSLRIDPSSAFFRSCAALLSGGAAALALLPSLSLAALPAGAAAGYFAGPYLSPWLQKLLLGGADVRGLSIVSVARRTRAATSFGGRVARAESGVEVTTSADGAIEAEIVDD